MGAIRLEFSLSRNNRRYTSGFSILSRITYCSHITDDIDPLIERSDSIPGFPKLIF
jgi:hypothetical protein